MHEQRVLLFMHTFLCQSVYLTMSLCHPLSLSVCLSLSPPVFILVFSSKHLSICFSPQKAMTESLAIISSVTRPFAQRLLLHFQRSPSSLRLSVINTLLLALKIKWL